MVTACTIVARNYLPHARVLAATFLEHHPRGEFFVLIIDDPQHELDVGAEPFQAVGLDEIGLPGPEVMILAGIYDVTELATAVKPTFLQWLLGSGRDHVIYLDPDIKVFGSLDEPASLARQHGIVLTPHTMVPMPDDGRGIGAADILAAGVYNLGFIAVGPSSEVFLRWWWTETDRNAISDPENQMFTDQRSIDFVPALYPHAILKSPAYNVAYWNLHGRDLVWTEGGYRVNGEPLRFFHFSGFDHRKPHLLSKHQGPNPRILLTERPGVARICAEYLEDLTRSGIFEKSALEYGWGRFGAGYPLTLRLRRLYRSAVIKAEQKGELPPPGPFEDHGKGFLAWLAEPVAAGPRPLISRYLFRLHQERGDLREHFPDLADRDAPRYLEWVASDGVVQDQIPPELVPSRDLIEAAREPAFVPPNELTRGVNIAGYFRAELGVGEAGRLLTSAIRSAGVPCEPIVYEATESRQQHPYEQSSALRAPHDVNVLCINADATPGFARDFGPGFFSGRHTIGLWFWEVERFPETMYGGFEYVDEVWAATRFVTSAIAAAKKRPVYTVPVPVAIPTWDRSVTRESLGLPDRFLFLFMFDLFSVIERKNPLGLVRAFCRAFAPDEGPVLVIKTINGRKRLTDLERLKAAIGDRRDILLIDEYYTATQKNALVGLCDCYVSLHRSEGLGLTMAEAMGLAKPVIATAYSGNLDFMTAENSFLVDYTTTAVPSGTDPYPSGTPWADPNLDAAAEHMRRVYENRAEAARRGLRARQDIEDRHGVRHCGEAVAERLDAIRAGRRHAPPPRLPVGGSGRRPQALLEEAAGLLTPATGLPATARLRDLRIGMQKLALRALRPYWWQQRTVQSLIIDAVAGIDQARSAETIERHRALSDRVDLQADALAEQSARTQATEAKVEALEARFAESRDIRQAVADTLAAERAEWRRAGEARSVELVSRVDAVNQRLDALEIAPGQLASLTSAVSELRQGADTLAARLQPVPYMVDPARFLIVEDGRTLLGYRPGTEPPSDIYRGFEDVFRGSESFIAERQRVYVPFLEGCEPVLDIGCGRGELLDLLRAHGIAARGVDSDTGMVEHSVSRGLDVVHADAIGYLEAQPPASLGGIVSLQVIEHLPYETLLRFLDLSHSRLRTGGRFIVETVNPHALEAFKTFWTDLSHKAPIFPEVALVLTWLHRYSEARVAFPQGKGDLDADRRSCGEYAVVATK